MNKWAKIGERIQMSEQGRTQSQVEKERHDSKRRKWMNKVEWVMRVGGNVHFVYAKPCWFLWFSMDQEHSGNQADTSQPAAESQPSLHVTLCFSQTQYMVMILHGVTNMD